MNPLRYLKKEYIQNIEIIIKVITNAKFPLHMIIFYYGIVKLASISFVEINYM
jgi:hypothetical protein